MLYDATYILVIIGAVISLIASARVNSTFKRFSKVRTQTGLTGAQAAQRMLEQAGIFDVTVRPCSGKLTDHYDPRSKTVNLSEPVFNSESVAAIGVACHECGHAIQHQENYGPLTVRSALVPAANFGSKFSWVLIAAGLLLTGYFENGGAMGIMVMNLGILLFGLAVAFQIVTLPVEFNASARALRNIQQHGFVTDSEYPMTKKVLKAAAMTYVAAAAASVLQLLRLILIRNSRRK